MGGLGSLKDLPPTRGYEAAHTVQRKASELAEAEHGDLAWVLLMEEDQPLVGRDAWREKLHALPACTFFLLFILVFHFN